MGAKGNINSQSLPRFPRTNSLKQRKIKVKIWHNNLGYIPLAWWIVRTYPVFLEVVEQMENQGKDWTLQVMILTTRGKNSLFVAIYPVFLELIQQIGVKIGYGKVMILSTCRLVQKMENWGEDWIWHVRIYSTCWINCQNSMKNGK